MNCRILSTFIALSLVAFSCAQEYPDLPKGITSFGAAVHHDGALYVFGGHLGTPHKYNWDDVHKPLLRLKLGDGAKAEWEELPTDEPALGPALVTHKSGLIRVGGMQPKNAKDEEQDMHSAPFVARFDPKKSEWTRLPDLPKPRSSHDAFISGDKLYVAGGWQMRGEESSLWANTVEVLDLAADEPKWKSIKQPFRRRALAVVASETKLYCLGGLNNGGELSLEVDILDLKTEEWSKGPSVPDGPMEGFGLGATLIGGRLVISGFSGQVYQLAENESWEKIGNLEDGRMFARLAPTSEKSGIVVGGAVKGGGRALRLETIQVD
ncbi:MAG: hypothetical protein AAF585_18035 [Verrucomicrobiota bacterium]